MPRVFSSPELEEVLSHDGGLPMRTTSASVVDGSSSRRSKSMLEPGVAKHLFGGNNSGPFLWMSWKTAKQGIAFSLLPGFSLHR